MPLISARSSVAVSLSEELVRVRLRTVFGRAGSTSSLSAADFVAALGRWTAAMHQVSLLGIGIGEMNPLDLHEVEEARAVCEFCDVSRWPEIFVHVRLPAAVGKTDGESTVSPSGNLRN